MADGARRDNLAGRVRSNVSARPHPGGATYCHPVWTARLGGYTSPAAVASGQVFVGGEKLYAVAAKSGAVIWSSPIGEMGSGASAPAVAGRVVFIGSETGRVFAFAAAGCGAATCAPLWSAQLASPTRGAATVYAPAVADGMVFATIYPGTLFAFGSSP